MLKGLFLAPGRLAAKLFAPNRKKDYRSLRPRAERGLFLLSLLSLAFWLALTGLLLHALDRGGLLKLALDAGVEAAQGEKPAAPAGPAPTAPDGNAAGGALSTADPEIPPHQPAALETEMWLVILHTIPKTSRAEAERRQAAYKTRGLEVDVLDTNAFPKLQPDLWIIALGPFDDRASALAAADQAKAFNSGLLVRRGL